MKKTTSILVHAYAFVFRSALVFSFVCACMSVFAQSPAQIEQAAVLVSQMIEEHQIIHKDVLAMREAAGYQVNPAVVVKAVFLRRMKIELPDKMHIQNALDASEIYCLNEKQFPPVMVTNVKNAVAQALQ